MSVYLQALSNAKKEQDKTTAQAQQVASLNLAGSSSGGSIGAGTAALSSSEDAEKEKLKLRVIAGSKVDTALMSAFTAVAQPGQAKHAEEAVSRRCMQKLNSMVGLLEDLAVLASWHSTCPCGNREAAESWGRILQHYHPRVGAYKRQLRQQAGRPIAAQAAQPPAAAAAAGRAAGVGGTAEGAGTSSTGGTLPGGTVNGAVGLDGGLILAEALLRRGGKERVSAMTPGLLLATTYRAYKKMILWDCVLAVQASSSS